MRIRNLDHFVLTVENVDATVEFYTRVLGMELVRFGQDRVALRYGSSKVNLHPAGNEIEPHALRPVPGSADLCFIVEGPLDEVHRHLIVEGVTVVLGPVARTGAQGPIDSVYVRDPDDNLVELSVYSD